MIIREKPAWLADELVAGTSFPVYWVRIDRVVYRARFPGPIDATSQGAWMSWTRTGIFITLTLVATTLPTNGHMALPDSKPTGAAEPAPGERQRGPAQDQPSSPTDSNGKTPARSQNKAPEGSGPFIQAACQVDFSGAVPQAAMVNNGPQLMATLTAGLVAPWKPSPALNRICSLTPPRARAKARECWPAVTPTRSLPFLTRATARPFSYAGTASPARPNP